MARENTLEIADDENLLESFISHLQAAVHEFQEDDTWDSKICGGDWDGGFTNLIHIRNIFVGKNRVSISNLYHTFLFFSIYRDSGRSAELSYYCTVLLTAPEVTRQQGQQTTTDMHCYIRLQKRPDTRYDMSRYTAISRFIKILFPKFLHNKRQHFPDMTIWWMILWPIDAAISTYTWSTAPANTQQTSKRATSKSKEDTPTTNG